MADERTCTKCRTSKPLTEFNAHPRYRGGINPHCRDCTRAYARESYARNKKHLQDTGELTLDCKHCGSTFTYVKTNGPRRSYCSQKCRFDSSASKRATRNDAMPRQCACGSTDVKPVGKPVCTTCRKDQRDRSGYNHIRRLSLYGLTQGDFDEMLALQRGRCGICATDDPGTRGWQVDHDHACCPGIGSCGDCVRGLLCQLCNRMLGLANDSVDRLEQAKKYLLANSKPALRVVK